jgi:RNA polymerase sigma-70 factor (ECF subfamily)
MDCEEFLQLLARHESQIMGFLWSVSPRGDVAEDLFQQTVLTMWQQIDQFESGSNFLAWACTIAKYKSLEHLRSRRRLLFDSDVVSQLADEHGSEDIELRLLRRRALVGCLEKLREDDRTLVETCYQGDRTIQQVASEIGRSARSLYKSLARIRKLLHRCVETRLAQEEH